MEGIKKIKILETGGGKEDNIFNFSLAEFPQGKNIISSPLFYILFFAYEKFLENENSL